MQYAGGLVLPPAGLELPAVADGGSGVCSPHAAAMAGRQRERVAVLVDAVGGVVALPLELHFTC
jgi:hypothetical protein